MPNLNTVLLMGNLTRDPEVRYTPKGTALGDLSIAINDSYKAQDGTMKETVTFVDIEVWGRQAETCKEYLSKGSSVFVDGKLKLDTWEKDGKKHQRLKVVANRVQFLSSRAPAPASRTTLPPRDEAPPPPDDDGDVPF